VVVIGLIRQERSALMSRSGHLRTCTYIGIAGGSFLVAVGLGINLLTEPEPAKADAWAFLAVVSTCLVGASLLWNGYTHRPRDDPKYWRQRAEEAHAHAEKLTDPASQRVMLEMASDYEKLAKRAEARLLSTQKSN